MDIKVWRSPPSASQLKRIKAQSIKDALSFPLAVGAMCLVMVGLASAGILPLAYLCLVLPVGLAVLLVGAMALDRHALQFREVCGAEDLKRLYQFCEYTPEGKAYRAAVVLEGRPMRYIEMEALAHWSNTAPERTAYKRMYDRDMEVPR